MSNPRFVITNGTDEVSLLDSQGFLMRDWRPSAASIRDGGVRNQSAMSDGSVPVMARWNNVTEQIMFVARHVSEDAIYEDIQKLLKLLQQAVEYWTSSWANPPVWLEVRGPNETNTRYAVIVMYSFPGITNPFAQPLFTCLQDPSVLVEIAIEHLPWQDAVPGTDTCIQISGTQSGELLYWASFEPDASLDDCYVDTAAGGTMYEAANMLRFGASGAVVTGSGSYSPTNGGGAMDDAYVKELSMGIETSQNYLAFGNSSQPLSAGIRFRAVGIPASATITSAYIRFTADATNYGSTVRTKIYGEYNAAPGGFVSYKDFRDRTRTTAYVQWDSLSSWTAGNTYDTPDISAVIQEINALGAVTELVVFVEDDGSDSGAYRRACAVEDTACTLYVEWSSIVGTDHFHAGIRFRNMTIPAYATILSASIRFVSNAADAGTPVYARIKYDDDGTPAAFSAGAAGYADFMARLAAAGATYTQWSNVPAWGAGSVAYSPSIKDMLQAWNNAYGGATELVIFIEDVGSATAAKREINSYDKSATTNARLDVTYSMGASTTFGRSATCLDEVYVANKNNQAQLTYSFRYDASAAIFGANRIGFAGAYDIFTTDNNDAVYFGVSDIATNPGPFSNIVFNISTAAVYTGNAYCFWEYYGAAGWTALDVTDETVVATIGSPTWYGAAGGRPFARTGVNSVAFEQPADWTTTTVNTVSGWWVRCRVSIPAAPGDSISIPRQTNTVYSVLWNSIQMQAAQVGGDIPLLGRIRANSHNHNEQINCVSTRLIVGARTTSRAKYECFDSFINLSDIQRDGTYTISPGSLGGFTGSSGTITDAPTGRWIRAVVPAAANDIAVRVVFDYFRQYEGTFHAYLRYKPTAAGTAGWPLRVRMEQYFSQRTTSWASLYNPGAAATSRVYIADLGVVRLHGVTPMKTEVDPLLRFGQIPSLFLYLYNPTGSSSTVDLIDLVLMPADEWIGDIRLPYTPDTGFPYDDAGSILSIGKYLDIDSARIPYYHTLGVLRNNSRQAVDNVDTLIYTTYASGPVTLQMNAEQDLHFLAMIHASGATGDSLWCSYPYPLFSIQLSGVKRYLLARGSQ